ncbi:ankyrin repeat domain-containing protein [Rickettsiales bacterium]|nr:ankyrin repeat domain-containing protein [Rickettsiales bacterium]
MLSNIRGAKLLLLNAVIQNDERALEILLNNRAKQNVIDDNGKTLLHIAAMNDSLKALELLIKNGAKIIETDNKKRTPLHYAAINGNKEALDLLIKNIAELIINNEVNLLDIIKPGNLDFIDNKVKVLIRDEKFNSAIGGELGALDDADVNLFDDNGFTLLHLAAHYGFLNIVECLLEKDDINYYATDKNGDTPLHLAARNNHANIVALLAGNNLINTNTVNKDEETPLLIAAKKGYLEVARHLIKNKANVNRPDKMAILLWIMLK